MFSNSQQHLRRAAPGVARATGIPFVSYRLFVSRGGGSRAHGGAEPGAFLL